MAVKRKSRTGAPTSPADHEASIDALVRRDRQTMLKLALNSHTPPEMLFVLSQAPETNIRTAIAANPSTPPAVNQSLACDTDPAVRGALVSRLAALLPDVSSTDQSRLADRGTRLLKTLADDADVAVRRLLAEEICKLPGVPSEIAMKLARDVDDLVAMPIVEFSPVLDTADLLALINAQGPSARLSAIARRDGVNGDVSDRLVLTGDVEAIGALLRNNCAQIREATLDYIVERANTVEPWHDALCKRPEITPKLALKLAGFVAVDLVMQLAKRSDLGAGTLDLLKKRMSQRLRAGNDTAKSYEVDVPSEEEIREAIERHREVKIIQLVASRSGLPSSAVRRIFATRKPESIIALAWKSGLSMGTAIMFQKYPGYVADGSQIGVGDDGNYPMSVNEMVWELSSHCSANRSPAEATK